jgi:hypothetical protein
MVGEHFNTRLADYRTGGEGICPQVIPRDLMPIGKAKSFDTGLDEARDRDPDGATSAGREDTGVAKRGVGVGATL